MITVDFRRLKIVPGMRVLDAGCGNGRHTAAVYGLERATAIGVDLCRQDLGEARERLRFHHRVGASGGGTWGLAAADNRFLPFADATFDLVICAEVLEHIPCHAVAAAELARVLKPGGQMVVSVPRAWPERICWRLAPDYSAANGGHVRIYRKKDLLALLEAAGLRFDGAHHAHSLHSPYWWLKCLVGPRRTDCKAVRLYQRFLTWDIMEKPPLTRLLDRLLNPVMGKSLVVYLHKPLG
jgi:SAM-dependent methyltransferase